jgi:uncharacterized tellurite resistance protein B-like protein
MLEAIKAFFEEHIAPHGHEATDEAERVQIAVAALLAEVVHSDDAIAESERAELMRSIAQRFGLDPDTAATLVALADEEGRAATDLYQFTSQINRAFDPDEKLMLIEQLWRVAFADGSLHRYEEHLVRKIAGLLHVSHGDLIATKLRVRGDA